MNKGNTTAQQVLAIDLGQFREVVEMALEVPIKDRSQRQQLEKLLALIDRQALQASPVGVAYLDIGAGGYMDLGSELSDEELAKLPYGRHVLGIIGTHGVDGYVLAQQPAAPSVEAGVVSDADIKWDMRHIESHLKDVDAAVPVLLQGVRKVIQRSVAQAITAKDAEIEALRAEVARQESLKEQRIFQCDGLEHRALAAEARAERLAEALRNIRRAALDGCSAMDCARDAYDALALEDRNG